MSLGQVAMTGAALLALTAVKPLANVMAQDCVGEKPRGGKYVASGELYIQTARRNVKPEDRRRNYKLAVDILREGFVEQPDNPRNYLMAGEAYVGLGDYESADSVWDIAVAMWSCYEAKADTLRYNAWVRAFNRGVTYASSDEWDKALVEYKNAWTVYDKLPQPQIQIGTYWARQAIGGGGTEEEQAEARAEAIEAFRRALVAMNEATRLTSEQRAEFDQATTFNLAQLLGFEERYLEAAEAYAAFLKSEPDNFTALSNMAVVLVLASNQRAEEAEALEGGPAKDELLAEADSLKEAAKTVYADLLAREDLDADQYYNIGVGLIRLGLTDDAVRAFVRVLDEQPYRYAALEQLAFALFTDQRYDTLVEVAQMLVDHYPLNLNNMAFLANAYRELERSEDALAVLERREALQFELVDLKLTSEQDSYVLTGYLHNISMDPETPVNLEFDFYDGEELVTSASLTLTTTEPETRAAFETPIDSSEPINGFVYRLAEVGQPTGS